MHKILTCCLIGLLAFGLGMNEAAAKRFGGGRSFGVQRAKSNFFKPKATKTTKSAAPSAKSRQKWGGVLGGMLLGGLLASLFMGNGLANGLIMWLIVGSIIFFIFSMYRKKMQPAFSAAHGSACTDKHDHGMNKNYAGFASDYPHRFDKVSFIRDAKVTFIRLQNAYDQKNLNDLSEFTAPEVFAEIKMQLDELEEGSNTTEVIQLEADLLDVSKQADGYIASVQFSGFIKEDNQPMTELNEIWHFRLYTPGTKWLVGGIQQ